MPLVPLPFYVLALVAYAFFFVERSRAVGKAATALLGAGVLAHTFIIGMRTMDAGQLPFAGTTQAISTFVWLLALAYLYMETSTDERGLGIFVLPIVVGLQLLSALQTPLDAPQASIFESPLFWLHVASLLFAYASFGLAAVIGITYLLQFKEIKAKQLGMFYSRLPSLQSLDVMNSRVVFVGWALLTIGLLAGLVWTLDARTAVPADSRVQAISMSDPKILVALLSWGLYTFQLLARRAIGWRGRRSAYLSALGFVVVLLNFVPVSYFLTDSHNFGAVRGPLPAAVVPGQSGPR